MKKISNKRIITSILLILLIGVACKKNEIDTTKPRESYIKNILIPDTTNYYNGIYYIYINFNEDIGSGIEELRATSENPFWNSPSQSGYGGLISQGIHFSISDSKDKLSLYVRFNPKLDSAFKITYADYYFSDPWRSDAGMNINYKTPVGGSSEDSQYYLYLGRNTHNSYFKISYIGNNRINGSFSAQMEECCGYNRVYNVTGDFSVPYNRYFIK